MSARGYSIEEVLRVSSEQTAQSTIKALPEG